MTDIVERLRKAAIEPCDGCCYGETMVEAADEIDRLRAENAGLIALLSGKDYIRNNADV